MNETLSALDATFLELEQLDHGALMSIGGVMVFDPLRDRGTPRIEDVRTNLAARLGSVPRYAQRLSSTRTGGFAWPHWEPDELFDVRNHVRHAVLPAPGADAQLCEWIAEFFSHPLDRTRPLWELVLLEGLEHGRWALAQKTHHCLVDGVGSVDVIELLLDSERDGERPVVAAADGSPTKLSTIALGSALPEPIVQAARAGAHALGGVVDAALHPRETLIRSRAFAELIVRDELIGAPHTSLNVPIGRSRRFAIVRVPLADLKAIGRELGGSVNDVVLAACTGGLRRLLLARDEPLPSRGLRAMVPMNVRDASDRLGLGNRVSSLFVELPVAEDDPRAQVALIAGSTRRLKATSAARGATTMIDLAALAPPVVVQAALARTAFATRLFNLTITNVPGPRTPLYAFGAQLRELHPVVPLAAAHAVGIAIFSYNGSVTFGINADAESMADLDVLAYGIEDALEQLRALAPSAQTVHT